MSSKAIEVLEPGKIDSLRDEKDKKTPNTYGVLLKRIPSGSKVPYDPAFELAIELQRWLWYKYGRLSRFYPISSIEILEDAIKTQYRCLVENKLPAVSGKNKRDCKAKEKERQESIDRIVNTFVKDVIDEFKRDYSDLIAELEISKP